MYRNDKISASASSTIHALGSHPLQMIKNPIPQDREPAWYIDARAGGGDNPCHRNAIAEGIKHQYGVEMELQNDGVGKTCQYKAYMIKAS